jgi:Tol biopolymer transport system component
VSCIAAVAIAVVVTATSATATGRTATTSRVSVSSAGAEANHESRNATINAGGRYVAFSSGASNLVRGDTNGVEDVFVRDLSVGTVMRVSISSAGEQADAAATQLSISDSGRFVTFTSWATNLGIGDANESGDVFVRDLRADTTSRLSVSSEGVEGDNTSEGSAISATGRFVAFVSHASNLVAGDTNGIQDVFLRDRATHTTRRVSVSSIGVEANDRSRGASVSADGRYVAFESFASNLVAGDDNGVIDVFIHDLRTDSTILVSRSSTGASANGGSLGASLAADGRRIVFSSAGSNLVPGDTNEATDMFARDLRTGSVTRIDLTGEGATPAEAFGASVSPDGRYVAFVSFTSDLVPGDTNDLADVFVRDLRYGVTSRVSVSTSGAQANGDSDGAAISANGRRVVFSSYASNLVPGDANGLLDVFVRNMAAAGR